MNLKKVTSVLTAAALILGIPVIPVQTVKADPAASSQEQSGGDLSTQVNDYEGTATKVYADTYAEPGNNRNWREGMVSGNGMNGVVTSGAPYSDTFIYQNIYLKMPSAAPRESLEVIPGELEPSREAVFNNDDSWNFYGRGRYFMYCFHPAHQLRLTMDKKEYSDYRRWTDYETAEVGVEYTDENGKWERKTFTSREDNVTITEIKQSSEGGKVNMTISIDNPSSMYKFGYGDEVNMQYKKLVNDSADYIALVSHYPAYEGSELREGGYAGLTQVVTVGGSKEKVSLEGSKDSQNVGEEANPGIKVKNADAVYLITRADRTHEMGALEDFAGMDRYELADQIYRATNAVAEKYSSDGSFDYEAALLPHARLHGEQFNNVKFSLDSSESDGRLTNNALLEKQKGEEDLNDALVERAYNAGRYAELCCSGYSTPMLGGIWTGEWNPGWRAIYTMDANVNLQVAPMNTGNMADAPVGYIYFILRQLEDWMENAECCYGMHDAIQVPVNTDGDRAHMIETEAVCPFQYWNAGASWMLLPIYEYWQCYGNQQIPISDVIDLYQVRGALGVEDGGLSEEEVDAIMEKNYLDLEKDILLPLLTKQANFWEQFCTPEYYTDANGVRHHEEGKEDLDLEAGERYLLLPCYSPENHPLGYTSALTVNATMDIAAAKDGLQMTIAMENAVNREGKEKNIARWEKILAGLPDYEYDGEPGVETSTGGNGALREWATLDYTENNNHRHMSHLYVAWPAYETQHNEELAEAAKAAVANRDRLNTGDNTTGHGWMHHALISARLKDGTDVYNSLDHILSSNIYYTSMMTDHNTNRGSDTYCTDTSIGLVGVINEALVFSNTGEIEILPALPEQWETGSIDGLMARTRAEIESLSWDNEKGTAEVTVRSDIDQDITLSSGQPWLKAEINSEEEVMSDDGEEIHLSMKAGETVTVRFITKEVNKDELKTNIDAAQSELDARQPENFPVSNETVNEHLSDVIDAAQTVYDNEAASGREVREVVWSLIDALRIFREAYTFPFDVSLASGIYEGKQKVNITHNPDPRLQIRYTLDGSDPAADSALYEEPLDLPLGITHLKAAQFAEGTGEQIGDTLSVSFQCNSGPDYIRGKAASSANPNYQGEVPGLAADGNTDTRWSVMGNYDSYVLEIDLGVPTEINSVVIDEYIEPLDQEDHRLENYEIQYYSDGAWKTAHVFNQENPSSDDIVLRPDGRAGKAHAYYGAQFETVTAERIRLVMEAAKEISIWEFAVYNNLDFTDYGNVALYKPVTVSSEHWQSPKDGAVDGDWNTRWAAGSYHFPESLTVDLQGEYYIEDIYTLFELVSGFQFKLEYSRDGENWITYADYTDNSDNILENLSEGAAVADYIRLTVTGSTELHWASIWELQVFGSRIVSMGPDQITGAVNEEIILPDTISLTLKSGEVKEYAVQWNDPSVMYETEGKYEVTGSVPELDSMEYKISVLINDRSEPTADPDRTGLNEAITLAESKKASDYTPSSFAVLKEKLESAKRTAADPDVAQEEIDAAANALYQAISSLTDAADKEILNNILIQARSILADKESYLESSIGGLENKIKEATSLLNDPEAVQTDVDAMAAELRDIIDKAVKGADKSALQAAVQEAEKYDLAIYTEESAEKLKDALESAKELLENNELNIQTQEKIDEAADALNDAIDRLELKAEPGDTEQPGDSGDDRQPVDIDDTGDNVQNAGSTGGDMGEDRTPGSTGAGNHGTSGGGSGDFIQTPQTGDTADLIIPCAAAAIAFAAVFAAAGFRRKKR